MQPYYTIEEIAKGWHVSEATVYRKIRIGELEATRFGRATRISDEARRRAEAAATKPANKAA